jgi:hypothetical protein
MASGFTKSGRVQEESLDRNTNLGESGIDSGRKLVPGAEKGAKT